MTTTELRMPLIEDLLSLYSVERQVRSLRSRVDTAATYVRLQEREMTSLQSRRDELETRKRQHQAHNHNLETEVAGIDERIEKLREELNAASTSRQYNAVLSEVNNLKDKRAAIEEQMLVEMSAIETTESDVVAIDEQITERTTVLESAKTELSNREEEIADSLATLEQERAVKAAVIPDGTNQLFDELADDFDGEAMASIEVIDKRRREYACGCCNVHLPFDVVSRVMGRPDEIMQCQGCLRILYAGDGCREALVK